MRTSEQRFGTFGSNKNRAAPSELNSFIGGHGYRLPHKCIAFLNAHIAQLISLGLRRKQRAVVAVTAALHLDDGFHLALLAKTIHEVLHGVERGSGFDHF